MGSVVESRVVVLILYKKRSFLMSRLKDTFTLTPEAAQILEKMKEKMTQSAGNYKEK